MQPKGAFMAGDIVMVRVSALPKELLPTAPETLDPSTPGSRREILRFLGQVASNSTVTDAIMVASPSLGMDLAKVVADGGADWTTTGRVALSAYRYVARMRSRATPFGLMAGVSLASPSESAQLRIGDRHRKVVRPDGEWLVGLIRRWEQSPQEIPNVRVWLHPACLRRGERLLLPNLESYHGGSSHGGVGQSEGSVRLTALVAHIVERCVTPVPIGSLVRGMGEAFPSSSRHGLWSAVRSLLEYGFLVSELWTTMEDPDPIGRLVALNPRSVRPDFADILSARSALMGYAATTFDGGTRELLAADSALRRVDVRRGSSDRASVVQVDLNMDLELQVPRHVLRHVEDAVSVLQRVSPARARMTDVVDYHRDFVERFGYLNPIPLNEALDPHRGIEAPAGFRRPPSRRVARSSAPHTGDELAKLADATLSALCSDSNELELTDELIDHLDAEPHAPVWPSLDISVRVHSRSLDAIAAGDYVLSFVPDGVAQQAGRMFGRFAVGLGATDTLSAMLDRYRSEAPEPVQLRYRPPGAHHFNVAHAPPSHTRRLWLDGPRRPDDGSFERRAGAHVRLEDLGLYASEEGLHVVDLVDGRELHPTTPHMLNPELAPNLARLLDRIEELSSRPFRMWSWRSLDAWPRLPRVRSGRVVLYPASWRALELTEKPSAPDREWSATLARWQQRLKVPDHLVVSHRGQALAVDISKSADRRLLRKELERNADPVLFEDLSSTLGDTGWLGGREHELTVPLFASPGRRRAARPRLRILGPNDSRRVADNPPTMHFPGGEWTYLRVHVAARSTDAFLIDSLPKLITTMNAVYSRWFFIRYDLPSDHIRIRVHSRPGKKRPAILAEVAKWAREEWRNGSLRDYDLATYVPETSRYGAGAAMHSAESVFWRDSEATLAQLRGRIARRLGISTQELAVLNYLHLLESFDQPHWRELVRDQIPRDRPEGISREQRSRLQRMAGSSDHWTRLAGDSAGRDLLASWQERAKTVVAYRNQLSILSSGDVGSAVTELMSFLHMQFNRLCGVDELKERQSLSLLRELVQSQLVRN
jgi:lantibiotic biosynthesis protein